MKNYRIEHGQESHSSWLEAMKPSMLDSPLRSLQEFADLPVKRFSNKHSESAAGYRRYPSAADLILVSNWIQSKAVYDYVYNNLDPTQELRLAAAYAYWHWAIRISRAGHSGTLLAGQIASSIFLLASIGDRPRSDLLLRQLPILRASGLLGNAGSKIGPFAIAIATSLEERGKEISVGAQFDEQIEDTSGAINAYQSLVDNLHENNPTVVTSAIHLACDAHKLETRPTTDSETHDFDSHSAAPLAFEVVFYARIRDWLGYQTILPNNPLADRSKSLLGLNNSILMDEVIAALLSRCLKTMEERPSLERFVIE